MSLKNVFILAFLSILYSQSSALPPLKQLFSKNENNVDGDMMYALCTYNKENSLNDVVPFEDPVKDSLDDLLIERTGCKYSGVSPYGGFSLPKVTYDGTPIEWFVAVRTQEKAYMDVEWETPNEYGFLIGQDGNTKSRLYLWEPYKRLLQKDTPNILSADQYVPFYFILTKDTMSFGKACTNEEIFSRNITLTIGQEVELSLRSHSHEFGAKYLYDCPENVTGGEE